MRNETRLRPIKHAVLRARTGKRNICSHQNKLKYIAHLRYAKEAIESTPNINHGILELLAQEIDKNKEKISSTEKTYEIDWVIPRKSKEKDDLYVDEVIKNLAIAFLRGRMRSPHAQSRRLFLKWFKSGLANEDPLSPVRLLVSDLIAGKRIRGMSDRELMDRFYRIKPVAIENVQR